MSTTQIRNIGKGADFKDKLIKLIPAEVIAAYMAIDGIIPRGTDGHSELTVWVSIVVALVLVAAIPFYLKRFYSVVNVPQIGFTMGSFVVWLYSIGGPFKYIRFDEKTLYVPWVASIILILWTLFIPFFVPASSSSDAEDT